MSNSGVVAGHSLGAVGSNTVIDGAGDFDGDGDNDILVHFDDAAGRHLTFLRMENGIVQAGVNLGVVGLDFHVDAVADFNQDGTADILMHRDFGGVRNLQILDIKNGVVQAARSIGATGLDQQIDGVGDFNGDGTPDILQHQDSNGSRFLRVIDMQNGNPTLVHTAGAIGADTQVDGIGDFNNDGTADVLLRHDVGAARSLDIVEFHFGQPTAGHSLGLVGNDFFIDGVGDFNNDGTADIALHRDHDGVRTLEILDINNFSVSAAHILGDTGIDFLIR